MEEFKTTSDDVDYLSRLITYIGEKDRQLILENNKSLELKNMRYLKKESDEIIERLSR